MKDMLRWRIPDRISSRGWYWFTVCWRREENPSAGQCYSGSGEGQEFQERVALCMENVED